MQTIHEAELIPLDSKHDRRGRRLVSLAERDQILERYRSSGLTMAQFARSEGIKYNTFTGWLYKSKRKNRPAKKPKKVHFTELSLPTGNPACSLEVCLPTGLIIRGSSAREVADLIRILGGV